MEERQEKVEEKPATYRKKIQYYAYGTFGVILVILFINMVLSIASRDDEKPKDNTKQEASSTATNTTEKFNELLKNSGARPSATVNQDNKTVESSDRAMNLQTRQENKSVHPYSRATALSEPGKGTRVSESSSPDDIRARFKADEINRALRARSDKTNFESSKNTVSGNAYAPASSFSGTKTNSQRISDINAEQNVLQERIQMMESKVLADEAAMPGRLAEAQRRGEMQLAEASQNGYGGNGVSRQGRNQTLPSGVVGYTASNPYGASVDGMMKLPVGTLMNAITTFTAISDYSGGSMKAMLTHDVYDSTYSYILAPKGSEFIIKVVKASQVNEILQSRVGFQVTWLVLPDGNRVDFKSSSGLDRMGTPAVEADEVDRHLLAQFLGVAAYALVGTKTSYEGSGDANESFAGNFGEGARSQAGNIAQKYLQVVPTATLHAGAPIRVFTEDEIFMKPWRNIYETDYAG